MPELPEVETTRRGIAPHLEGRTVTRLIVRDRRLRWPIPEDLDIQIEGQTFTAVRRRAKYLLMEIGGGTLISHLGMSGNLRLVPVGYAGTQARTCGHRAGFRHGPALYRPAPLRRNALEP